MSSTNQGSAIDLLPVGDSWTRRVAPLGRAGWVARGVSYFLLGVIAVLLAVGVFTEEATQKGALRLVAEATGGRLVLFVLALGFALFALWEATYLLVMRGEDAMTWLDRLGKVIGVGFYLSLAYSAVQLGALSSESQSKWSVERLSALALRYPLGRAGLIAAGLIVGAIAIRRGSRTVTGDFSEDLRLSSTGEKRRHTVKTLGRFGETGRALAFLLIALFLVIAGIQGQASEAAGLDSALRRTTGSAAGATLVGITGLGLAIYGMFCAASAQFRRMPTEGDS